MSLAMRSSCGPTQPRRYSIARRLVGGAEECFAFKFPHVGKYSRRCSVSLVARVIAHHRASSWSNSSSSVKHRDNIPSPASAAARSERAARDVDRLRPRTQGRHEFRADRARRQKEAARTIEVRAIFESLDFPTTGL